MEIGNVLKETTTDLIHGHVAETANGHNLKKNCEKILHRIIKVY